MAEYTPSEGDARAAYRQGMKHVPGTEYDETSAEFNRFLARVRRDAGRAAMLKFVEEAEKYRDLRDASDDRHSAQDVDGWWYVISAADEHIAEFHPDPEQEDQT